MMPGDIGMRHYSALTGIAPPRNDNARRQPGEVGKAKQRQTDYRRTAKRLPPYARPLIELRRQGLRPAGQTVIVLLDRWPPSEHVGIDSEGEVIKPGRAPQLQYPKVTIPPDSEPSALDFGFLRDLEVIVGVWRSSTEPPRVRAALRAILAADPRMLLALDMEHERKAWFIKSLSRGVEVVL